MKTIICSGLIAWLGVAGSSCDVDRTFCKLTPIHIANGTYKTAMAPPDAGVNDAGFSPLYTAESDYTLTIAVGTQAPVVETFTRGSAHWRHEYFVRARVNVTLDE